MGRRAKHLLVCRGRVKESRCCLSQDLGEGRVEEGFLFLEYKRSRSGSQRGRIQEAGGLFEDIHHNVFGMKPFLQVLGIPTGLVSTVSSRMR